MRFASSHTQEQLRRKMVQAQLRARGIHDERILHLMETVPRHKFIPPAQRHEAYRDQPVGIGYGQTISQPYMVALMTEKLDLREEDIVLEVGTGCGYQTAILASLVRHVYTIEICEPLSIQARKRLREMGIDNVTYLVGDGWQGWPGELKFDRILVAAAAEEVPAQLQAQLKDGGKLIIPVDAGAGQKLILLEKQGQRMKESFICYCRFVRLVHQ